MSQSRRQRREEKKVEKKIKQKYARFESNINGLVDMHCQNLDDIAISCKRQAAKFGEKYLPSKMLGIILGECKLDTDTGFKDTDKNNAGFNTFLDNMLKILIEISGNMNSDNIPVENISNAIEHLKSEYREFKR